jgi:hypothetical protein
VPRPFTFDEPPPQRIERKGSPRAVTAAEAGDESQTEDRRLDEQKADWLAVMGTPAGRRVLQDIVEFCQPDHDLHPGFFPDERVLSAALGTRRVGLWVRQQVANLASPEMVLKMAREHADETPHAVLRMDAP